VVGRGETLPEAFAQVALGVFALVADPASVEERDAREVRAHGNAPEALLVNWLNECLYVLDVEGFVARRVEFGNFSLDPAAPGGEPLRLHCRLLGEDFDPARHVLRETLSGILAEGAAVFAIENGSEARVFVRNEGATTASPK
jgi:protein archease